MHDERFQVDDDNDSGKAGMMSGLMRNGCTDGFSKLQVDEDDDNSHCKK